MSASKPISRRRFLRQAGLGLAVPYILSDRALGRGRHTPPSERITLGIIGLKKMGSVHVKTLLGYDDFQILAVCDVNTDTRRQTRQLVEQHYGAQQRSGQHAGCAAYNEYERIMARSDIDAVVIAVPDHWHAIMSVAACRAGKDVYCEKPLSLTIREAHEMVKAARRHGTVFQTGTQQRSSREFRQACELVRNGYIGEIRAVHVGVGPCSRHVGLAEEPVPPGLDYDRWLGPAPWAPYNRTRCGSYYDDGWRRIRDYSGGKMTDWGAHHFDIVQWALGMDDSGPVEIVPPPREGRAHWDDMPQIVEGSGASERDPTRGLTYHYANGVAVIKDGPSGIRFVGTEGRIEVGRGELTTQPRSLKSQRIGPSEVRLYRSPGHHQNWLECIRSRRYPVSDVAIGARSATMCHLGNIALWLDRPVRWDPMQEQIVGDERAARWLDRPKRAPYRL